MKRILLNIADIVFLWIVIPAILIVISLTIDRSIALPQVIKFEAVGWIITIVSAAMLAISIIQFTRDTGGLPVSAYPPDHIVRNGIYVFYRHPIYLFYLCIFVGIALVMRSSGMLFIVLSVFICAVVIYAWIEEKKLSWLITGTILIHFVLPLPFHIKCIMLPPMRYSVKELPPCSSNYWGAYRRRDIFMISLRSNGSCRCSKKAG